MVFSLHSHNEFLFCIALLLLLNLKKKIHYKFSFNDHNEVWYFQKYLIYRFNHSLFCSKLIWQQCFISKFKAFEQIASKKYCALSTCLSKL